MDKKSRLYVFFIILFVAVCCVPSLGMLAVGEAEPAENEVLAEFPALFDEAGDLNPHFLDELTDYTAERFAFRQEMVTANAAVSAGIFRYSPADGVVMGKDGWLFYEDTLDDYLRSSVMTDREIYGAVHSLAMVRDRCESSGVRFLFTAVPNKNSLYPEYMSFTGTPLDRPKNLELMEKELAAQSVDCLDLTEELGKEEEVLYFSMDSHWNNKGAALARDLMVRKLGLPDDEWFSRGEYTMEATHKGDLYEMLYPKGKRLEADVSFKRELSYVDLDGGGKPDRMMIKTTCEGKPGHLYMFRDSFGNALYPFMAESFGEAEFSRSVPYDIETAIASGADDLVIEIVERNLEWLKKYPPFMAAPLVTDQGLTAELLRAEVASEEVSDVADSLDVSDALDNLDNSRDSDASDVSDGTGAGVSKFTVSAAGFLEGYMKMSGVIDPVDGDVDTDSPVYIILSGSKGDKVYEGFPIGDFTEEDCFTAYLPENELETSGNVYIAVKCSGIWQKYRVI